MKYVPVSAVLARVERILLDLENADAGNDQSIIKAAGRAERELLDLKAGLLFYEEAAPNTPGPGLSKKRQKSRRRPARRKPLHK